MASAATIDSGARRSQATNRAEADGLLLRVRQVRKQAENNALVGRLDTEELDALAIRFRNGPFVEQVDDVEVGQGARRILKRPEAGKVTMVTENLRRRFGKKVRGLLEIDQQRAIPAGIAE